MLQDFRAERALGYQQLTIDATTSQALTVPAGTQLILISPETQAIRIRDDGTNPTASVGYPVPTGAEMRYSGGNMAALKIIGQVASSVVNVLYYG
jgi:hypothetical protein